MWKRLMGNVVLDSGLPIRQGLHVYAHCLRGAPGGVAFLVVNNDRTRATSIALPGTVDRFTLSAQPLTSRQVLLNGAPLALRANDALPSLVALRQPGATVTFQPATITFLAMPEAANGNCG
jgi:hypothetical protein